MTTDTLTLPSEGGSYVRLPDGSLQRTDIDDTPPPPRKRGRRTEPEQPLDPAEAPAPAENPAINQE
jgi:hypothetical protein